MRSRKSTLEMENYGARALPWLERACCLFLAVLLLWKGILPGWHAVNTDFPNYYLVARLIREGYSLDRIYDWIWLQRIKDHWGINQSLVGFAGLTPFSALPVLPFSIYSALVAKRLWILANLVFLGTSVELLNRVTCLGRRRIWLLSLLAIFPLRTSFLFGQMHLIVLFFIALAYFFYRRNRQVACGVCMTLAGALKVYPLFFGLYFLWKKQWRPALAMFFSSLAFVGIGGLWMGTSVFRTYTLQVLPRSIQGEVLDPYHVIAASGASLFHRLFIFEPILNPVPSFNAPWMYAVGYPLWQLAIFLPLFAVLRSVPAEPDREHLEWAAFLVSLLVSSPVPSSYHFVVLAFSIVLFVDVLLRRRHYRALSMGIALYASISVIQMLPLPEGHGFVVAFIAFARLWLLLLLWALFIVYLRRDRPLPHFAGANGRRLFLLCIVAPPLWAASAVGYYLHFVGIEKEMGRRMAVPTSAFLATGLRPRPGGYLFTAMLPNGYRILDQEGHEISHGSNDQHGVDQLTFAVSGDRSLLLEVADAGGSRIIRDSGELPISQGTGVAQLHIQDAESPAVSADGRSVAFIREKRGKGTLWVTHFATAMAMAENVQPVEVVGDAYDVRNALFLRSGILIFVAKANQRLSLFSVSPGSLPNRLSNANEDIASFAVSADEKFIAFTKLIDNRWQLGFMNTGSSHEKMLTFGDCNAYSPTWLDPLTVGYSSDCGRGLGLTALASVRIGDIR